MVLRMFKLIDSLEAGKSARARLYRWNGERYIDDFDVIHVHDYIGECGGRGDRGYCYFSEISRRWEVLRGLLSTAHQPAPVTSRRARCAQGNRRDFFAGTWVAPRESEKAAVRRGAPLLSSFWRTSSAR